MSNNFIRVEVSESTATLARRVIFIALGIFAFFMILSIVAFISGNMSFAIMTVVIAFAVIVIGYLIYGIILLLGSMKKHEQMTVATRIAIIVPSSLAFMFLLLWILGVFE